MVKAYVFSGDSSCLFNYHAENLKENVMIYHNSFKILRFQDTIQVIDSKTTKEIVDPLVSIRKTKKGFKISSKTETL